MNTPAPTHLNEHHIWGGPSLDQQDMISDNQQTLIGNQGPMTGIPATSSQAHLLASSSDNLFHPTPSGPPPLPYSLPPVPSFPNAFSHQVPYSPSQPFHHNHVTSYIPVNRDYLSKPLFRPSLQPSSFTSYNNPAFALPSVPLHSQLPHAFISTAPPPSHIPDPIATSHPQSNQFPYQTQSSSQAPPFSSAYIPPFINQFPYHNFYSQPSAPFPNVRPVPTPSSFNQTTHIPKTLPSVAHIPTLTNKFDFFAWDEAVTSLICANGLLGHILDPSEPLDPARPDRVPAPLPALPVPSSPADVAAFQNRVCPSWFASFIEFGYTNRAFCLPNTSPLLWHLQLL
jgi:hypothetical protein